MVNPAGQKNDCFKKMGGLGADKNIYDVKAT